jgi:fructokinase
MGSSLGLKTGFIGVVGNDDFGVSLITKLKQDGVDISQVRTHPNKTTGIAFVQYNKDGSRKFIFAAGAAGETCPDDLKGILL